MVSLSRNPEGVPLFNFIVGQLDRTVHQVDNVVLQGAHPKIFIKHCDALYQLAPAYRSLPNKQPYD